MSPNAFLELLAGFGDAEALAYADTSYRYDELVDAVRSRKPLRARVVAISGPITFESVVLMLAAWREGSIVALLGPANAKRVSICQAEAVWQEGQLTWTGAQATHPLFDQLEGRAGIVLFTSGSSGEPKAVLHRVEPWLAKVSRPGRKQRTLGFLSFDHIGGLNTLLYALAHGGMIVVPPDRSPATVWQTILDHSVELLPTTPSFLRLAMLQGDVPPLPSLKLIAYGSEPMPEATLESARRAFPGVDFLQQYGMSELGVLRSRSRDASSTWVRMGGSEFDLRVADGLLEVRAETAMVGYLNAPSPFTVDGWLQTGDEAEVDGEWLRIRGRRNETINVGGEKVHPIEVEVALESLPGVLQAVVRGEPNAVMGQVVVAAVQLSDDEGLDAFRLRMRSALRQKLPRHAIPMKVEALASTTTTERFKKVRRNAA